MPNYITHNGTVRTPSVLRLPPARGRDFFVGDIHGAFTLLAAALNQLRFDPKVDRLICAGDLVDRGDRSSAVLDFLPEDWLYSIRGNHEQMLLDGYEPTPQNYFWKRQSQKHGGGWFLHEPVAQQRRILAAFRALPLVIEIPTPHGLVGIVHGEVPVGMDWSEFTRRIEQLDLDVCDSACWGRDRIQDKIHDAVPGVWRIFAGHSIRVARPRWQGNICYGDTGGNVAWDRGPGQGYALSVLNIQAPYDAIASAGQDGMLTLVDC